MHIDCQDGNRFPSNAGGVLVISLDFELMWGSLDVSAPFAYRKNIEGAREAVPKILSLFEKYGVHATWGIVGLLMQKSIQACSNNLPEVMPNYDQPSLSVYSYFDLLRECDNRLLFAGELVEMIGRSQNQEIGTHTYSHYYCMESGQTKEAFECDLQLAKKAVCDHAKSVRSMILPRNQFNLAYADVMTKNGILNYRGNENVWFYRSCETKKKKSPVLRLMRLLDAYTGIFGNHCYPISSIREASGLNNIRSSRFFRPYSKHMAVLEPLRMRRIFMQMTFAAKHNQVFHLWFHPHNFGCNTKRNLQNLEQILLHYRALKAQYGMESMTMGELGDIVP